MKQIVTPCIEINQPIGTFYLGKVRASDLRDAVTISRKSDLTIGQQRDLDVKRVNEIAFYCLDPDATFPTSVILSVEISDNVNCSIENNIMTIDFQKTFGEVIDGQHRLYGIWSSTLENSFELPIVFMINPTIEEKAYVFSIINSKQTKVNPSLIYDLFDVSTHRSPQKTAHLIARTLNSREDSPFYHRLKMLGKNSENQKNATLSQGTFSNRILKLMTRDASKDSIAIKVGQKPLSDDSLIFREFFLKERDDIILKILLNYFNAIRKVFTKEWEQPQSYILWKSTGFNALIDSLPAIYQIALNDKNLTVKEFESLFSNVSYYLNSKQMQLTSSFFGSGESETKKLKKIIIGSCFNKDF